MIGQLKSLGIGGGLGLLVGILLVVWIDPTTNSGIMVVLAICTLIGLLIGESIVLLRRKPAAK